MMSNLYLSPLWTSTPGRRGEEGSVRDRNTEWEGEMDGLMEWWHKKWTHSLRRFAKTPIKQFFSKVYLDSLHQDVHFPSYFPLLVFPSFFFLNGSPALKTTFNSIYSSHLFHVTLLSSPTVSCCLYCSLISTASLSPPSFSLSPSLCYVCCLAALSFTCQLGSGLWSSNMTNCPLIHTHARRHKKCAHL